jgi:hypothetical protein
MEGRIAVLQAEGPRGRAVLFSPHPEMGDLLVKYMALEGYMPRYLPIRGEQVMRETLDAYRPEESRSFLMILNAVEAMASGAREAVPDATPPERALSESASKKLRGLVDAWHERAGALIPTASGIGELEQYLLRGFQARLPIASDALLALLPKLAASRHDGPRLAASFAALAEHAVAAWANPPERRPAELLLELELALLLIEAWRRQGELHLMIETHV